jgi:serine/threonine protein kinase
MQAKPAPSSNLMALPDGTELVGDYRIKRVLGAGGFGITYLADEKALARLVTIKEYFPSDLAARQETSAAPRSKESAGGFQWGLDRFSEEAQTLARFDHPNIVRVHRYFRANSTAYMVLHFEEGGSFKAWLRNLKRAPRQAELDAMLAPLLDALEMIHKANYLHRDIAPDNIMVRKDGSPVLIDFGSARGEIAAQSRTVSALVKPGYSPYEQYATTSSNQGPWTDIYALGSTLYHAITGKRPPDAPSRVVNDEYVPAREAVLGSYRSGFLDAIDKALKIETGERPQSIAAWRGQLFVPDPKRELRDLPIVRKLGQLRTAVAAPLARTPEKDKALTVTAPPSLLPAPPDAPQPKGQLLDFIDALKKKSAPALAPRKKTAPKVVAPKPAKPAAAARPAGAVEEKPAFFRFNFGGPSEALAPAKPPKAKVEKPAKAPIRRETPAKEAAPRRAPPKPRRAWRMPSRRWRSLMFKVAAAVGVASLAVAYQQQRNPRIEAHSVTASAPADVADLTPTFRLEGHKGAIAGIATADQGRWIVTAGSDATIKIWSATSGALVRSIDLGEGPATALAAKDKRAIVGHGNGLAVVWDLERAEKLATFRLGSAPITGLAFTSDPGGVVAASRDGSIALVEADSPATPAVALEAGDGGARLLDAARARGLVVTSGPERTLHLFRAEGGSLMRTFRNQAGELTALKLSDDGRYIAAAGAGSVLVWTNGSSRPVARLRTAAQDRVTAMAFGPERLLATASDEGRLRVWNVRNGRLLRTLRVGAKDMRLLQFSGDGRFLFGAGANGGVQVWTLAPLGASGGT